MSTTSAFAQRHVTTIIAAAVASLLACAPACAKSTASASLGPISITLFDLNPNDGVAPSITFNNPYGYGSYVYAYANDYFNGQVSSEGIYGSGPWVPVSVATSGVAHAWANASVSGTGDAVSSTFFASGTALGTNDIDPSAPKYSQFQAGAYGDGYAQSFTLSANTAVVVSAQSLLGAGVTHVWDPASSYGWEQASATASLSFSGPGPGGGGGQSSSDTASVSAGSTYYDTSPPCGSMTDGYCWGPMSASDSRLLSASFVNFTSASMDGYLQSYAGASGYSYAPAVPEPASVALLLAGLGAIGFVVRRRA